MSINNFEIIKQIESGVFSSVSLVKRKQDNIIYPIKRVELSKKKYDTILNEISLFASVNHRNIIVYKESFYEESSNILNITL
jgi:NIMA (never in mitosis gene a)-related kinase